MDAIVTTMDRAYIFLADGFEDIEALATRDTLHRAGIPVELISITEDPFIVSSHGLPVSVEGFLDGLDPDPGDVLIFPGGMPGSKKLATCKPLIKLMLKHHEQGGVLAAICAAPGLVLGQLPDLSGVEITCFDGFEQSLTAKGAHFVRKPAVTSGNIITGRSAGYSVPFALEIVRRMRGEGMAAEVSHGLLLPID